jgi:hypothetical protein
MRNVPIDEANVLLSKVEHFYSNTLFNHFSTVKQRFKYSIYFYADYGHQCLFTVIVAYFYNEILI